MDFKVIGYRTCAEHASAKILECASVAKCLKSGDR
jgi:hypothetical protein